MKNALLISGLLLTLVLLGSCSPASTAEIEREVSEPEIEALEVDLKAAFLKGGCGACHKIPGIPGAAGTIGPDLTEVSASAQGHMQAEEYSGSAVTVEEFIHESITSPDAFVRQDCPGGPCQAGLMPGTFAELFNPAELDALTAYLAGLPENTLESAGTVAAAGDGPALSEAEWEQATEIFFDRCAGCHGVLRKGATGPALTPDLTREKGTVALSAIIFNGTPRGMPDWGKQGVLTEEQAELMAKFNRSTSGTGRTFLR